MSMATLNTFKKRFQQAVKYPYNGTDIHIGEVTAKHNDGTIVFSLQVGCPSREFETGKERHEFVVALERELRDILETTFRESDMVCELKLVPLPRTGEWHTHLRQPKCAEPPVESTFGMKRRAEEVQKLLRQKRQRSTDSGTDGAALSQAMYANRLTTYMRNFESLCSCEAGLEVQRYLTSSLPSGHRFCDELANEVQTTVSGCLAEELRPRILAAVRNPLGYTTLLDEVKSPVNATVANFLKNRLSPSYLSSSDILHKLLEDVRRCADKRDNAPLTEQDVSVLIAFDAITAPGK